MRWECDVALVGAGPAGLFAARELAPARLRVVVVEKGLAPKERTSLTCGVGGAGAFSDGKLNLTPRIGGEPEALGLGPAEAMALIRYVDETFTQYGAPLEYSGEDEDALSRLRRVAAEAGVEFLAGRQRHIGTTKIREVIDNLYQDLVRRGVTFLLGRRVHTIRQEGKGFVLDLGGDEVVARYVIAAPGRGGAYWLREVTRAMGIGPDFGPLDVGVRVEFPAEIYAPIERIMYDAKFRVRTPTYDDMVRTFCTNPRGFVVAEDHGDYVLVNGHAENETKTANTNFALLVRIELTDPVEDTTEYGRAIAKLATTIGGGKPILQRLKDLRQGRRSTLERIRRVPIEPTLKDFTPGDISMALPHRVVVDLVEALAMLDRVMPGVDSGSTLLYAPEIKFYDTRYRVRAGMETELPGFYVAGDASGHSRGIVFAAVTGILAARHILSRHA
ncbi:MAG: FAD-dependent monooxygenase [Candidatus Bipolaricaulota bacterium]|nr:FAD-dependent monooxygenase [Candidatus Bipolaricaulota bacterium]MDW8152550.1 FAD-dependent monooxygenase [Candidatus Bipolaricaulota bacterium]